MGTEVLYSQDVLASRGLGSFSPSFAPLRRQISRASPARNPKLRRRRGEGLPELKGGGSGVSQPALSQVKILKRGESLDSTPAGKGRIRRSDGRRGDKQEQLLEPAAARQQINPVEEKASIVLKREIYAGSAFTQSPSPRALPLPKFRSRMAEDGEAVDQSATRDLIRLLRLV